MTPPEIMTALSQGHERPPRDALEAASPQRSEVSSLLLKTRPLVRKVYDADLLLGGRL